MQNKDLFGNDIEPTSPITERTCVGKKVINNSARVAHGKLLLLYGKNEDKKCKDCDHLRRRSMGGTYYKCELFSLSRSPTSDWRINWQACGKFIHESNVEEK